MLLEIESTCPPVSGMPYYGCYAAVFWVLRAEQMLGAVFSTFSAQLIHNL